MAKKKIKAQSKKAIDCVFKKTCRICDSRRFAKILDLGKMPPANAFLKKSQILKPERAFPLAVYLCRDCSLLQLRHVVRPEILFKNYPYETSASSPLVKHFKKLSREIVSKHIASKKDLAVEIGSNDGVLLENFKPFARILGIDPARGMAELAAKKGVPTVIDFFNEKTAQKIIKTHGKAKVIVANNVIAHIDDIQSVFRGIAQLLRHDGRFIFEVHWAGNLIGAGGFDQIYHEHLCYFSLYAVSRLTAKFGLVILDVSLLPIHGESLRVTVGKTGSASKTVELFLKKEKKLGLEKISSYKKFALKVKKNKENLSVLLKRLKKDGRKISGYGAPAKGNTLLNYFGIGRGLLDFITDTTPQKQGLFAPGSKISIVAPEKLITEKPDYILLLSWNYSDVILQKEKGLRQWGVKFIIPVPEVKIV